MSKLTLVNLVSTAIFLALITSLAINNYYSGDKLFPTPQQQVEISLCTGIGPPVSVKTIQVIGGKPFSRRTAVSNTLVQTCSVTDTTQGSGSKEFINESVDALKTWEFYANWAVWSVPYLLILLAARKYYANYRH